MSACILRTIVLSQQAKVLPVLPIVGGGVVMREHQENWLLVGPIRY
jgi:hypothetical protein